MMLNGPWSLDRGQLRDKDGNALASFPIHPDGLGGAEDLRNGELCTLLPQLLTTLAQLVDRCERAPILEGNEGMRAPLLAEAKAVLLRAGIETARPAPGATYQGWLTYRGVPVVIVVDAKDRETLSDACGLLIQANRKKPDIARRVRVFDRDMTITGANVNRVAIATVVTWLKEQFGAVEIVPRDQEAEPCTE